MKNKYIIFGGILLATMIGGGMFFTTNHNDSKFSNHAFAQESDHEVHDEHNEHHEHHEHDDEGHFENDHNKHDDNGEIHVEDQSEDIHDLHDEKLEGGVHDEESDIVEITKAQQEEIGLVVTTARSGDIEHILSFVGEVRLHEDRMAHLVPKVPGIVRNVFVSLGEKVREGQVLAIIDSPELAELKADYLEKLRNLELTRRTFERKQYLKQENIASEADWLEVQSALQNAETILHSAKRRLVVLGIDEDDIRNLPDARDEAFGGYTLKSPIAGTIIARHITRGEKVGEEDVFIVADLSVVWVDLQIPAKDLGKVKRGLRVEITSTEGELTEGKLTLVGPVVDKESRTVLGRVVLPNPEDLWKPGLFVKGQIQGKTSSSTVVVPSGAVQNIDGENIIFVPDGDGYKPVMVTLGKSIKDKTEILAGLTAGDRYVARGAFELKAIIVTSGAGAHAGHGH